MLAVFPPPRPSHIDASLALDIYLKINKTVTLFANLSIFLFVLLLLFCVASCICFVSSQGNTLWS